MKTILITGASSGIGWGTLKTLVEQGYRVVATVRQTSDAEHIRQSFPGKGLPLLVDVEDFTAIEKIPEILKSEYQIQSLDGLINNAGIAVAGPFLDQDFKEIEKIIRINLLAVMKITQVLLPLLGAVPKSNHQGKIINISSISGRGGAPFLSAYAASKHAIEGFSEALRKEMMLFNIPVIVVGPGSIKTPIWSKGFGQIRDRYKHSIYSESFQRFIAIASAEEKNALEVSKVADLILHILNIDNPCFRYAPIPRKWLNWYIPLLIPKRFYNYLTAKSLKLSQ